VLHLIREYVNPWSAADWPEKVPRIAGLFVRTKCGKVVHRGYASNTRSPGETYCAECEKES